MVADMEIKTVNKNMNSKLKSLLTTIFFYLYAALLFGFAISVLMLISYVGLKKELDWNGIYLLFGILIPILILMEFIKRKIKSKNVG